MCDEKPFWKFIEENRVEMKGYDHDVALIQKQKQIDSIKAISTDKLVQFDLFKLLFLTAFQRVILGAHFYSPQTKILMSPMGSSSQGTNKHRRWALTRIVYQRPATQ
jgi:hypothetical protein